MVRRGDPVPETSEVEATPEAAAGRAVESAVSAVDGSGDGKFKRGAKAVGNWFLDNDSAVRIIPILGYRIISSIFKFAIKLIQKKGNVSFNEGYDIGQEAFSFEADKKGKK